MASRIKLTPGQAVTLHGWVRPVLSLSWKETVRYDLTFQRLLAVRLRPRELFAMQPDLRKWIEAGRVSLEDCPQLKPWGAHPVRDLRADLGDLIMQRWSIDALTDMGVTYGDLKGVGMTPETMAMFGFSLVGWHKLGMSRADAEWIPGPLHLSLFQMHKPAVLAALPR